MLVLVFAILIPLGLLLRRGWVGRVRSGRLIRPRLGQRLDNNWQNFRRADVTQRPRHRLREFDVRIEFGDELPDERHVHRPSDDMDPVRPHIGGDLDLADDDRIFRERSERAEIAFHRNLGVDLAER